MFAMTAQDREALTGLLQDLVRLPSLSGQEKLVAERLEEAMHQIGIPEVWSDRIGNVIGHIGPGSGPRLFLEGHMDIVGVGTSTSWERDPYAAIVENGVLYGRGAMDTKGSLAAMVYGAKKLLDSDIQLAGDVYIVAVVNEEPTEGLALKVLVEEEGLRPDFVVVGEPSNLQVKRGHRGRMEMEVTVRGRSCHASSPKLGENAIYGAARIIFGLELLSDQLANDNFLGPGSLAVTRIESLAGSKNVIPDLCRFIIDRRLTVGETEGVALTQVQNVIDRERLNAGVVVPEFRVVSYKGYEAQGREYYPAWVISKDHPLIEAAVRAVQRELGHRPQVGHWDFSTDGVYSMGVMGIPTVGFGPGEERYAHTTDERIRLADVFDAASVYARLVVETLGQRQ
jgi:putative selenium metabolism hydrolase